MKKKILFPTDFSVSSKKAFDVALRIAEKMKANLHVLHVVVPEVEALDIPIMAAEATKKRVEIAQEVIESFINQGMPKMNEEIQSEIDKSIEVGLPGSVIAHKAKELKVHFIIMGAQGEHSTFDRIFGSVSSSVISKAECPVMIIPEKAELKDISNVLYATDYQETDPFHINRLVELLHPFSEVIRCVHVSTRSGSGKKPLTLEKLKNFFSAHSPTIQISFHEWKGESVKKGLLEFAGVYEIDLLAMLIQKRNFLEKLTHFSKTRSVVHDSKLPIIIMHEH